MQETAIRSVLAVIFTTEVFAESSTSAVESTDRSSQFVFVLAVGQPAIRQRLAQLRAVSTTESSFSDKTGGRSKRPLSTTRRSVGSTPFGACGDNTECKFLEFPARVGLCLRR